MASMIYILKETTKWTCTVQNNLYFFDGKPGKTGGEAIAYKNGNSEEPFFFKKPLKIDFKNRTFEVVDNSNVT
jgi:hypothetical protein